jgi:hypothetical protein
MMMLPSLFVYVSFSNFASYRRVKSRIYNSRGLSAIRFPGSLYARILARIDCVDEQ